MEDINGFITLEQLEALHAQPYDIYNGKNATMREVRWLHFIGNPERQPNDYIPDFLFELTHLSGVMIDNLNPFITYKLLSILPNFRHLTILAVNNQYIKQVPSDLFQLRFLSTLLLKLPRVNEIPSRIGRLQYLNQFHIDCINVETVPESLYDIGALKKLQIYNNELLFSNVDIARLPNTSVSHQ